MRRTTLQSPRQSRRLLTSILGVALLTACAACSKPSSSDAGKSADRPAVPLSPSAPVVRIKTDDVSPGLSHLSWDTEGGEKAATSLLRAGESVRVQFLSGGAWQDAKLVDHGHRSDENIVVWMLEAGESLLGWRVETTNELDRIVTERGSKIPPERIGSLSLTVYGLLPFPAAAGSLRLIFPFDPKVTSTTVLPAEWLDDGTFRLPAVVNAPDWGPMLLTEAKERPVVGRLEGSRSAKTLDLLLELPALPTTEPVALTLTPLLLAPPDGLPEASRELWLAARRGWLNALQPCARWGEQDKPFSAPPGILGNNVISDPASVSIWFYADQAFFYPYVTPRISVMPLVRRTIDYWLDKRMRADAAGRLTGEITGYWDYGDFLDAEASPLIAAWDYVESTGDLDWLRRRIERLELAADFLARRDVDGDGFVEATQSGTPNALQQPGRSDAWWDALNCGHKDGYTNALIYRAWRSLADLEAKLGRAEKAGTYSRLADRLKAAYTSTLLNPATGWLAWWKDRDGALHDYASPTLNGLAIEYGLVEPAMARDILFRLWKKLAEVRFGRYDLGVPPMLVPVHRSDYLQPNCLGLPAREDGTDTFGYYMNGGITAGHVLHFLMAHYVFDDPELAGRADMILRALLQRQRRGEFQNGVRDATFEGIDWTTWDGKPAGYEGYLADSFRFLQAVLMREPALRTRLYRPLGPRAGAKLPRSGESARSAEKLTLPAGFPSAQPYFVRIPSRADWRMLSKAPRSLDQARKWGPLYDLRHADLSGLDLTGRAPDLRDAFFDTATKWPTALPSGFDPVRVLDLNRDPGLGLRDLHRRGVTGRGVAVAVIDTPILLDHVEYGDRLRFYGEINAKGVPANFHGTLVTSILAGRTCGVAPEAGIYYVGSHNYDVSTDMRPDVGHYARALDQLLEVNARLPRDQRIRVVSISAGWGPRDPGFKAMNAAVRKAAAAGIFVVSANIFDAFKPGFWFWGADRAGMDSPDEPASYRAQAWKDWISQVGGRDKFDKFYAGRLEGAGSPEFLVIPQGSKTVAQAGGPDEYGFYRLGGWSSVIPYIAGLYALACQVDPEITPEVFWKAALATGDPVPVESGTRAFSGKRVDPSRLIEALRSPREKNIAYLETAARDLLARCVIKAADGTPLYTPDGKANYAALWTRDFASMVEYAGDLMPAVDIEKCIDYLIKGIRADGAVPDRVQVDGRPVYAAGSPEKPLGEPNLDNGPFLVFAAASCLDKVPAERRAFLYRKWAPALAKGMRYVPLAPSGLVWNDPDKPHSPYGFTDTVGKTGELFMESVLFWRAAKILAVWGRTYGDLDGEAVWMKRARAIETHIAALWDEATGMFFAASRDCRQTDIWGSAFAVYYDFPLGDKKDRIVAWLAGNVDRYIWHGQVRHLPAGEYWQRQLMPVEKERYQNGAYWATASGWVMGALNDKDPALAERLFADLIDDFRTGGICECVNSDGYRQLPSYVNSATNPLGAARRLWRK